MTLPDSQLGGLLLAAGGSERLGQPKQLCEWQGKTLLEHAVRALQSVCGGVTVVTGAGSTALDDCLTALSVHSVANPDWQSGLASSLLTGLQATDTDALHGVLVTLVDQPLVDGRELTRLVSLWRERPEVDQQG